MSALFSEESRIAELLLRAMRRMSGGASEAEAAAAIGVPVETLRGWRASLARAEAKAERRRPRRVMAAFPKYDPNL